MTDIGNLYGLVFSAFLAVAVLRLAILGARGKWKHPALAILFVGGGLGWLIGIVRIAVQFPQAALLRQFDLTQDSRIRLYYWFVDSIFWLLLYYALRTLRLDTWPRRLIAVAAVDCASIFFFTASRAAWIVVSGLDAPVQWLPSPGLFSSMSSSVYGYAGLVETAFQVWLMQRWIHASSNSPVTADSTSAVGNQGVLMSKLTNQSTRLLCASVVLDHGGARKKLLDWLNDDNRAVALELGVDLALAAQVARFAEKRSRRSWLVYLGVFCVALLASLFAVEWIAGILILAGVIAAVFWARQHIEERDDFAPMFWPNTFDPESVAKKFPAALKAKDLSALPLPEQNFFVYGGFMPFIGAGHDLGGWSVVIALDKASTHFAAASTIKPFNVSEVYAAIDSGLDSLTVTDVQKMDCYFANGTDVRGNEDLLPNKFGRPARHISDAAAARYRCADDAKVRHYRSYRIVDWGGELGLSYYIRCAILGKTLFVETKRFILTPLSASYRTVDTLVAMELKEKFGSLIGGMVVGPLMLVGSPLWALAEANRFVAETFGSNGEKHRRALIERSPLYNYGAATSLRQELSSGAYGHYFQKMDGDLYNKLFEHEVLDSLVEFLDAHGIDSSDLKERQSTILNNGVMVQGGDVNAESLAVGTAAKAVKKVKKAFAPAAGAAAQGAEA